MRVWFQKHVVAGRNPDLDRWYDKHIAGVIDPHTTITVGTLPESVYDATLPDDLVGFGAIGVAFGRYFADSALRAQRAGYDAWISGAGQDPGLAEARLLTSIVVVGYGETSFLHCAQLGARFGIIGFHADLQDAITATVDRLRLQRLLAGYYVIPHGIDTVTQAVAGEPSVLIAALSAAGARAAAAGAQILIPAEGLCNEALVHAGIRQLAGLPVIDPGGLAIKTAEHLVALRRLGIAERPTTGYHFRQPAAEVLDHVIAATRPEPAPYPAMDSDKNGERSRDVNPRA